MIFTKTKITPPLLILCVINIEKYLQNTQLFTAL